MTSTHHQLAHNINDQAVSRSKDVALEENVTFSDFLLSPETRLGLKKCGFDRPSPIQFKTIPLGLCGFDIVAQSKAGTGKTCIFSLIALEALKFNKSGNTQTLIITPTREIASQIHDVIKQVGSLHDNLRVALCIGGIEVKQNRQDMASPCQIVVGTPGRIKQLIMLNIINVQYVELFVLDEADKLMDDQFKSQIDDIYQRLPRDKQMVVTSATYPNELATFLQRYMRMPMSIRLGTELKLEGVQEYFIKSSAGSSNKKTMTNKLSILRQLLLKIVFRKGFIFTNYQARAPMICDDLNNDSDFVQCNGRTGYLCAELTQQERNENFNTFRNSPNQKLLVSTDISARGIDIHDIEIVINFDLTNDKNTYYHRIGRAGRYGQPGRAISIVSNESVDKSIFETHILNDRIKEIKLDKLEM